MFKRKMQGVFGKKKERAVGTEGNRQRQQDRPQRAWMHGLALTLPPLPV